MLFLAWCPPFVPCGREGRKASDSSLPSKLQERAEWGCLFWLCWTSFVREWGPGGQSGLLSVLPYACCCWEDFLWQLLRGGSRVAARLPLLLLSGVFVSFPVLPPTATIPPPTPRQWGFPSWNGPLVLSPCGPTEGTKVGPVTSESLPSFFSWAVGMVSGAGGGGQKRSGWGWWGWWWCGWLGCSQDPPTAEPRPRGGGME